MMGSHSDGQAPSREATPGPAGDPAQEEPGRGFLGRILSALSSGSEAGAETPGGSATAPTPVGGLAALRRLDVDDVAVPKAEIVAVPMDISLDELVAVFRSHGFSRLPVYEGTLDEPRGLVLLKDLALQCGFGAAGAFAMRNLLRPILFAPPSMSAGSLLQKMQKERVHMALVIDEYGGVDGLVTIEDLIETVLGEIEDEHDEESGEPWKEEAPGQFLVDSTAPLDDLESALGLRLRSEEGDDEIDTIGGLAVVRAGHMPRRGEVVLLGESVAIEIVDADKRRLRSLRLRLAEAQPAPAPGALRGAGAI